MKILITGGCGFVGSNIAIYLKKNLKEAKIICLDNLTRKGSKLNKNRLKKYKIRLLRNKDNIIQIKECLYVIPSNEIN